MRNCSGRVIVSQWKPSFLEGKTLFSESASALNPLHCDKTDDTWYYDGVIAVDMYVNNNFSLNVIAYLHCRIRIPILILIWTANQMTTLYYAELFTLPGVRFRIWSKLPTTRMGLHWRIQGGAGTRATLPWSNFFHLHAVFGKKLPNNRFSPPSSGVGVPPSEKFWIWIKIGIGIRIC